LFANRKRGWKSSSEGSRVTGSRDLAFYSHQLGTQVGGPRLASHHETLVVARLGVARERPHRATRSMRSTCVLRTDGRTPSSLGYEIDGAVVKVDDLAQRTELGFTSRAPRGSVAQVPTGEKTTLLRNIMVSIGRTGRATPFAEMEPVFVGGSTVRRNLHNRRRRAQGCAHRRHRHRAQAVTSFPKWWARRRGAQEGRAGGSSRGVRCAQNRWFDSRARRTPTA
jgi:DNA ligase (NAD+)